MVNSRAKGAQFERAIAGFLTEELCGPDEKFVRDLEQYRQTDHGDIIAQNMERWPWVIECKRYKSGDKMRPEWWEQAKKAADRVGRWPCVIYKFDHRDTRVVVPLHVVMGENEDNGLVCVLDLEGFVYLARELI